MDEMDDGLRPDYDLRMLLKDGIRGKYVERYLAGTNLVLLDPDVAKAFPHEGWRHGMVVSVSSAKVSRGEDMSQEIRDASEADLERLFDLWAQMQYPHTAYHPDYYPMADDAAVEHALKAHLKGMLDKPDTRILVAVADGQIVGYCVGVIETKPPVYRPVKQLHVLQAVVDQDYRHRGIFSRLHRRLCEWGVDLGAIEAELMVDVLNPAVAVYEHMGYASVQLKMVVRLAALDAESVGAAAQRC
jgi:GNAT superfamily N-acetyltransferase